MCVRVIMCCGGGATDVILAQWLRVFASNTMPAMCSPRAFATCTCVERAHMRSVTQCAGWLGDDGAMHVSHGVRHITVRVCTVVGVPGYGTTRVHSLIRSQRLNFTDRRVLGSHMNKLCVYESDHWRCFLPAPPSAAAPASAAASGFFGANSDDEVCDVIEHECVSCMSCVRV
jgi:hypothetical protein